MEIGLIGLGKMGSGMAGRLHRHGHAVLGFDLAETATAATRELGVAVVSSAADLVQRLSRPRVVWLMLPPGATTQRAVEELLPLMSAGDLLVDGGNSDFREAAARAGLAAEHGVAFMDVGVSGGQWGWRDGYGLMAGGSHEDFERLLPSLEALAAPGGASRVGGIGSGHFVKAVHNAVQYGIMEAYAEGFTLLSAMEGVDALEGLRAWQSGSSIRSWLLEQILAAAEENPTLEDAPTRVSDSGMGRWTAQEAVHRGIPTPVLTAALHARFESQDGEHLGNRLLSAARLQIGGHR